MFWKRIIFVLVLPPVVFFSLLIGLFSLAVGEAYIANNKILTEYEQKFREIPHPSETSAVESRQIVIRPEGNGNNCSYFVGEVRRFSTNRSNIKAFYTDQQVRLLFFEDYQPNERHIYGLNQLSNWGISKTNDKSFYLVFTLNTRFDEFNQMDLRCQ